jgi:hypothetical protein
MPICVVTQMGIADWCNQIQTAPRTKVCYHIHVLVEIYRNTIKQMTLEAHICERTLSCWYVNFQCRVSCNLKRNC